MKKTFEKPKYKDWTRERVKITDLFLDPENIRLLQPLDAQESLINDLFVNEDAMQVLESISSHGFFPDELPVVVKEKKKYVVIEGNRRIASLKALLRPQVVPSREKRIEILAKDLGYSIDEIDVLVAPNRAAVNHFLASKHTQNTRRAWRPLRQAHFYQAELSRGKTVEELRNEYPNVNIERFLRMLSVHQIAKSIKFDSDSIDQKVRDERSFPATTIERLYEDKNVRDFLGFDFDKDGEVNIQIERKEFEKGFKRIVQDVVEKNIDSRKLNKEDQRKKYLASLPPSDVPNKTKATGKILTSKNFRPLQVVKTQKRKSPAPKNVKFGLNAPGVRKMLNELQTIDHHRFPNAAHDLLRSFLECALKAYFSHIGQALQPQRQGGYVYLDGALDAFIAKMKTEQNHELRQVGERIRDDSKMTAYSALLFNAINHNPSIFARPEDVEDAWDAMDKMLRFILDPK